MRNLGLLCVVCSIAFSTQAQITVKRDTLLMGSRFDITVTSNSEQRANQHVDDVITELIRIENAISEWRPETQISAVNKQSGLQPVKVSWEVFQLAKRALQFSDNTAGAFDISIAAMDKIWKFDGATDEIPTAEQIQQSIAKVDYRNIVLNPLDTTIFLKNKGMKIGFGATGKGYAADRGRNFLKSKGVEGGIVNASGDLSTWGSQADGKPWRIGVTNPFKRNTPLKVVSLRNGAVTTSGAYEKFILWEDKRYSHIINPKTGWPATGITSVTVFGPLSEIANGLSTSIMVLGIEQAKTLIAQYPDYAFLILTDAGKTVKSKGFRKIVKRLRK